MKKSIKFIAYICLVLILATTATVSALAISQVTPNQESNNVVLGKSIDVYVLAGQSNMAGTSNLSQLPKEYRKQYNNVKMYYEVGDGKSTEMKRWTVVKPGQGACFGGVDRFGPELGMAEVLNKRDTEIAFIKYAYGGTAIYQHDGLNNNPSNRNNWHGPWDTATPGNLYNGLIRTVNTALAELRELGYNPQIKGMAWMQGETDGEIQFNQGTHAAADVYEHNLTEFFNAVRNEFNVPDMPIVFGEIYEYSVSVIQARKIVQAQMAVGQLPNNYFIETGDLAIDGSVDTWHWNGIAEYLLGVRFGEALYMANNGLMTK